MYINRYHWMYSATAYNHAYNDSGIFCIHASCHPTQMQDLTQVSDDIIIVNYCWVVQVLLRELVAITGDITHEELERAKTQLKSMLLMNLESRPVIFEGTVSIFSSFFSNWLFLDCARQVLSMGYRRKPEHFISLIDKVTISMFYAWNEHLHARISFI